MTYFIIACIIILCGFVTAFLPKYKIKINIILLISILCLPLGIALILNQVFKY